MKSRTQWCKNFALGACLGVTRGQKVGFWSFLLGFWARTLKLSQVIALWMRTGGTHLEFDVHGDTRWRWQGDMRWRAIDLLQFFNEKKKKCLLLFFFCYIYSSGVCECVGLSWGLNNQIKPNPWEFYRKFWLGGSVGCAVRLETRRSRVQPPPRSATFFRGDWSWNIFYGHSLPSADSRRAVVGFWRKNKHNTG